MGRQTHHLGRIDRAGQLAAGLEHRLQRLGSLVVGHHHDHRLLGRPRHQRQIKRTRRRRQSGHTSPPRTKAQMPLYALKPRRVLQLREDFADKRENHVVSVYQRGMTPIPDGLRLPTSNANAFRYLQQHQQMERIRL